jgi:hypothetical protein
MFDDGLLLRATLSLSAVAGLILLLARFARLAGWDRSRGLGGGKETRLRLQETLFLDAKRRLVLIAWDGDEYLLLLGLGAETVLARRSVSIV